MNACNARGTPSGSIVWLINCQLPETNLNVSGSTPNACSALRILVAVTTVSQSAQNSSTPRLSVPKLIRSNIAISIANPWIHRKLAEARALPGLFGLCGFSKLADFQLAHRQWIKIALRDELSV